jgi:hypothetical protein
MFSECRIILKSSVLASVLYLPEKRLLEVEFRSGQRYLYSDVPPTRIDDLLTAESKGLYFNANIRNCFAASQVILP